MNQAEYLCHSSGPWKKHKYLQKIGEGANAKYYYGNSKIGADVAEAAKWTAEDVIDDAKSEAGNAISNGVYKAGRFLGEKSGYHDRQRMLEAQENHRIANDIRKETHIENPKNKQEKQWNAMADQNVKNFRDTAHGAKQRYSKTPLGKVESSIKRGQARIDKLFGKN